MILFTRRARLAPGNSRDAMSWAIAQNERVHRITGLDAHLFATTFSPGVGGIVWAVFVPDLTTLEGASDKLAVDDEFVAASDEAARYLAGGADDTLAQVLHGEPQAGRSNEYVVSIRTVCAAGSLVRGIELGIEIADRATAISGVPTMFSLETTGTYGAVRWTSGYHDAADMERAELAVNSDPDFLAFVDEGAKGVYADSPTATTQTILRRMA
jgi:hypothetical protein